MSSLYKFVLQIIYKIHELLLRLTFNDYASSFYDMPSSLTEKEIHHRCINIFLTEVEKYLDVLSPEGMNKVFYLRQNHYNLIILNDFATDNPRKNFLLSSTVLFNEQIFNGKHYLPKLKTVPSM